VQAKLNEGMGYFGYEHLRPTYPVYRAAIEALPGRPVFSEDRFRIRVPPRYPEKDYDEELTRRGFYHATLAGGVAGIWGTNHPGGWGPGDLSRPYPHPEIVKTWARFFEHRFTVDMESRSDDAGTYALVRKGGKGFVIYREDASAIELDLTSLPESSSGVAVDTKRAYEEIPIAALEPGKRTWKAPYESDWVIAIGDFTEETSTP
ncbi:MAG TPA: hypothetical protein VK116_06710, partial [Planctomycetota bacterium]|nr:hypothetical protein [Planctomycetota bacterium]